MARKILLADDSVTAQNMGRKILADAGYEVFTVNNGSAALKKIAEAKPDLIVLDVYMPGYSGLEVCQRLKEAGDTARIPIVLTVGKLEPFKPEEARRVRADGFIVKPFEASELLSALSKLEDKIVPRHEPSKPGRFARLNASLDEGRYDKSMVMEEDAGWKNRISFPSKKKKAAESEQGEDTAVSNSANKDLRNVNERKPDQKPQQVREEPRVDLGALAPEGLPANVTPEEIAALAAAAAQVKGKLADVTVPEPAAKSAEVTDEASGMIVAETTQVDLKANDKHEHGPEARPVIEFPKETASATPEPKSEEKIEVAAESPSKATGENSSLNAVNPAEVIAATEALEQAGTSSQAISAYGSGEHKTADELATMAVAAETESAPALSRWTAAAAALLPEEASISLEEEMQKAHAALAAVEAAQAVPVAVIPDPQPTSVQPAATSEAQSRIEAKPFEIAAPPAARLEPAVPTHAQASSAAEAIDAAVKELEAVAASFVDLHPATQSSARAEPESVPETAVAAVAPTASESSPHIESKSDETPILEVASAEPETPRSEEPAIAQETVSAQDQETPVVEIHVSNTKLEKHGPDEPAPAETIPSSTMSEATAQSEERALAIAERFLSPAEKSHASPISDDEIKPAAKAHHPGGTDHRTKSESEIADTTAAAWASWRRVRESGDTRGESSKESKTKSEDPASQHAAKAAMAVAAGAEKSPEEASAGEDSEVSAIVDSVLADLRPKIVEEISRKLGKKK